ncbi:hypothetical protein MRB53_041585 [Persea americana]|nr:hypothetical protein MRB53_041585 [Persea americana]
MLQATSLDVTVDGPFSRSNSPAPHLNRFDTMRPSSPAEPRLPDALSPDRGRTIETQTTISPSQDSLTTSTAPSAELTPTIRLDTSQLPAADAPESPSTTDVQMQKVKFQPLEKGSSPAKQVDERSTSLNHALTNINHPARVHPGTGCCLANTSQRARRGQKFALLLDRSMPSRMWQTRRKEGSH